MAVNSPYQAKEQLLEVAVFLLLIVPSMILSFFVIHQGSAGFVFTAFAVILRDLSLVCLIFFFIWRNGESLKQLGWNFPHASREAALGIALFFPMFFGAGLLGQVLQSAGFSRPATPLPSFLKAKGPDELILALVLVAVVAIVEETIFRGYLLLRFQNLKLSPTRAVLLSSVIFALGHGYEGSSGVVTVGALGLVLATVYLWRQSLVAPMVMHFLQDFTGIVLAPWLMLK